MVGIVEACSALIAWSETLSHFNAFLCPDQIHINSDGDSIYENVGVMDNEVFFDSTNTHLNDMSGDNGEGWNDMDFGAKPKTFMDPLMLNKWEALNTVRIAIVDSINDSRMKEQYSHLLQEWSLEFDASLNDRLQALWSMWVELVGDEWNSNSKSILEKALAPIQRAIIEWKSFCIPVDGELGISDASPGWVYVAGRKKGNTRVCRVDSIDHLEIDLGIAEVLGIEAIINDLLLAATMHDLYARITQQLGLTGENFCMLGELPIHKLLEEAEFLSSIDIIDNHNDNTLHVSKRLLTGSLDESILSQVRQSVHEVFAHAATVEMGGVDDDGGVSDNAHLALQDRFFAPETMEIAQSLIAVYDVLVMHEISLYGFFHATPNLITRSGTDYVSEDDNSQDIATENFYGNNDDDLASSGIVNDMTMHLRDSLLPALLLRWTSLLPMVNALLNTALDVGSAELLRVYRDCGSNYYDTPSLDDIVSGQSHKIGVANNSSIKSDIPYSDNSHLLSKNRREMEIQKHDHITPVFKKLLKLKNKINNMIGEAHTSKGVGINSGVGNGDMNNRRNVIAKSDNSTPTAEELMDLEPHDTGINVVGADQPRVLRQLLSCYLQAIDLLYVL